MKRFLFLSFALLAVLVQLCWADDSGALLAVTTLGLFGTGDFETNETPEDWREAILYLFPNGEAPLTAMMARMKREETMSRKFHWWEKGLVTKSTTSTAIDAADASPLTLADTSMLRAGTLIYNLRTSEICLCTADPADATTQAVTRGASNTTSLDTADGDEWMVIGTSFEEGSTSGNPIYTGPGEVWNYSQIFKTPLEITNSANKETTRTGSKYQDMKEEALRSHSIDMEFAFLFGNRHQDTGPGGKPRRFTGGAVKHFITTNRFDASGTLTTANWEGYMEQLFQKGSMERVVFAGTRWIRTVTDMIKANTQYRVMTGEKVYGNRYTRIVTPYGMDLLLMVHPLFNTTTTLGKAAVCLDLANITERPFRDTEFKTDVQDNDADEKKDVFITETGLEIQHEETHAWFEDFDAFSDA